MSETSTFVETWDTLLKHFCSRDDLRPAMCKPNIVGEFVYATDAHSWLKVPFQPSFRTYGTHAKTPNFAGVVANWIYLDTPVTISKKSIVKSLSDFDKVPDWTYCNKCKGTGAIECRCCGNESDCELCTGEGTIDDYTVPEVYVNVDADDSGAIQILDNLVAPFQLGRLLRALDFLSVDNVSLTTNIKHKELVFDANGIEIVVMPLINENIKYDKVVKLAI